MIAAYFQADAETWGLTEALLVDLEHDAKSNYLGLFLYLLES